MLSPASPSSGPTEASTGGATTDEGAGRRSLKPGWRGLRRGDLESPADRSGRTRLRQTSPEFLWPRCSGLQPAPATDHTATVQPVTSSAATGSAGISISSSSVRSSCCSSRVIDACAATKAATRLSISSSHSPTSRSVETERRDLSLRRSANRSGSALARRANSYSSIATPFGDLLGICDHGPSPRERERCPDAAVLVYDDSHGHAIPCPFNDPPAVVLLLDDLTGLQRDINHHSDDRRLTPVGRELRLTWTTSSVSVPTTSLGIADDDVLTAIVR
jgi:hypothetical protein